MQDTNDGATVERPVATPSRSEATAADAAPAAAPSENTAGDVDTPNDGAKDGKGDTDGMDKTKVAPQKSRQEPSESFQWS